MKQLVDYRKEYHIAADQGIPTTSTARPSSSTTTPSASITPTIPSTSPLSSTTDYSTVPPQRRCSQLCDGAGDGETVGDCCGEHFCYCTTSGNVIPSHCGSVSKYHVSLLVQVLIRWSAPLGRCSVPCCRTVCTTPPVSLTRRTAVAYREQWRTL